jgi:glycosyltransferase involved in cell wall biosynthesis
VTFQQTILVTTTWRLVRLTIATWKQEKEIIPQLPSCILQIGREQENVNVKGVQFTGEIAHEDISLYYAASYIHVLPTLADNLPYTPLESMACGTPVVASRVGGVPEEVIDERTGLLVPAADTESIGRAILRLLQNDEERVAMGSAALNWVREKFNMQQFIAAHRKLYETIVVRP